MLKLYKVSYINIITKRLKLKSYTHKETVNLYLKIKLLSFILKLLIYYIVILVIN